MDSRLYPLALSLLPLPPAFRLYNLHVKNIFHYTKITKYNGNEYKTSTPVINM